ncbi:alpha/beta hydrolase [Psychromonas sp. B3M02]|uniref:alpha/beta fold hydrolase n=1 Tax=Psychromonas sp. B3M02 TaxID=2267226 RepID=UPI000DE9F69D|nr:alpha/beta fold hydrolase [Psychromonas sp. B3M02]RBW41613.1 alpha/beta hydrolase [Psychromonas sp. B3M02]
MLLNYQLKPSTRDQSPDKKQVIFLIHGLFGSLSNLSGLGKELQSDYDVILVDVRNHGQSERNSSMSYPQMANDIFELADHLQIEQFSILGHSMGGKIAMSCALAQPQRIQRLIVADIAPTSHADKHSDVFAGLKAVKASNVQSRTAADKVLADYVETPEVRQFLLKSYQRTAEGFQFVYDLENLYNNYASIIDWPEQSNTYTSPTLFIKGELSDYIEEASQPAIVALFPNAKLKVINATGHWLHAEKPKTFNRLAINFFAQ